MDLQLQTLSEYIALPSKAVGDQIMVALQLVKHMRPSFPRCVIVPFGSAISGLGTATSDCDLIFFADPPASLVDVLSGSRYFSSPMLSILKKLEDKCGVNFFPQISPSKVSIIKKKIRNFHASSGQEEIYGQVVNLIYNNKNLSKPYSIPKARTPIVKFVHDSTSLHCDICVGSFLGVLNTRLIKAYCDFDERVVVLIRVVKYWASDHGLTRNHINSYCLSLMVIFALQQCSPPVLPCLQSPGKWPKNLEWQKNKQHFLLENDVDEKFTKPWNVHFHPPQSLAPTKNSDGIENLLLRFFYYYANVFDSNKHAVCVRSSNLMPKAVLARQTSKPAGEEWDALIVQDPFDLSHNVAKILRFGNYRHFKNLCLRMLQS